MSAHYKHLSLDERVQIDKYHDQGMSIGQIVERLGRCASTVHREIKRGSWRAADMSAAYTPYRPGALKIGPWTGLQYRAP